MSDEFDSTWEGQRLEQLVKQCFGEKIIEGKVVFVCEDNKLMDITTSTWHFSDTDRQQMRETGFQIFCLNLLGHFVEYRAMHKVLEFRGGILSLQKRMHTIEWLSKSDAIKEMDSGKYLDMF